VRKQIGLHKGCWILVAPTLVMNFHWNKEKGSQDKAHNISAIRYSLNTNITRAVTQLCQMVASMISCVLLIGYNRLILSIWLLHDYNFISFIQVTEMFALLFFAHDFAIAIFGYVLELNIGLRLLNNHCIDWPEILYLVLLVCYLNASSSKRSNST
jgi:hypothetical protein